MNFLRILNAVLKGIFDEAAYERFCRAHSLPQDRESYSEFLRQEESKQKIRCC